MAKIAILILFSFCTQFSACLVKIDFIWVQIKQKKAKYTMKLALALFQPDIAQNTGTIIRLCACLSVKLHIIHPTGFEFSHKKLKRAGMDYIELAHIIEHDSFEKFENWRIKNNRRLILLTTKAKYSLYQAKFQKSDILMLGRESSGVPDYVAQGADLSVRIPMNNKARSLNVAICSALALGEAMRQTGGFSDLT